LFNHQIQNFLQLSETRPSSIRRSKPFAIRKRVASSSRCRMETSNQVLTDRTYRYWQAMVYAREQSAFLFWWPTDKMNDCPLPPWNRTLWR
jgi:hypothetical protein